MAEVIWQQGNVTREQRAAIRGHAGATLWLTGLPASGKTTIAVALEDVLVRRGVAAYRLDGDNVRHGLCSDLGHKYGRHRYQLSDFGLDEADITRATAPHLEDG